MIIMISPFFHHCSWFSSPCLMDKSPCGLFLSQQPHSDQHLHPRRTAWVPPSSTFAGVDVPSADDRGGGGNQPDNAGGFNPSRIWLNIIKWNYQLLVQIYISIYDQLYNMCIYIYTLIYKHRYNRFQSFTNSSDSCIDLVRKGCLYNLLISDPQPCWSTTFSRIKTVPSLIRRVHHPVSINFWYKIRRPHIFVCYVYYEPYNSWAKL